MNRKHLLKCCITCAAFPLALLPRLGAQERPTSADPEHAKEDIVELSPFVVTSAEDQGYAAQYTLAGTRIRTDIKDVGSSISVITAKFLQDTGSTNSTQLLVYTANTEVVGQGGNFLGIGDAGYAGQVRYGTTRVRGLTAADNTRDFFLSDIPWDSYNVGRVDIQRGPNSILFGIGSPAGIINYSLNHAAFKDSNRIENKVDNYGTIRFSGDFNKVLLDNQLSIRISLLDDDTKFRQDPAYREDKRGYVAFRWDPAFLNKGSMHTSLEGSYEKGKIRSNLPRPAPPFDYLTPWFTTLRSLQGKGMDITNAQTIANSHALYGLTVGVADTVTQGGPILAYNQGRATGFNYQENSQNLYTGDGFITGIGGYGSYINNYTSMPGASLKAWKNRIIADRSTFDSYDTLLDGDTKGEFNNFHALDLAFRQSFFDDSLGYEFAFDHQYVHDGAHHFLSDGSYGIAIDVMGNQLGGILPGTPNPAGGVYAGTPNPVNPNLGKPYVIGGASNSGFNWNTHEKTNYRFTGFYNLDFKKVTGKDSFLGRMFGENRFTALASQYVDKLATAGGQDYRVDDNYAMYGQEGHRAWIFDYLTGTALSGSSAANLHLPGLISNPVLESSYTVGQFDNTITKSWVQRPFSLIRNYDLPETQRQYTSASLKQTTVNSEAVVWQGYWLDSTIIPMFALRRDSAFQRDGGTAPSNKVKLTSPLTGSNFTDTYYQPFSQNYVLGDKTPTTNVTSRTYSVVTHLPKKWRQKIPGEMDLQLIYNQSENFQPQPGRVDIENRPLANPSGRTKEYGVAISALHDKLYLKVVHYETHENNANLGDIGSIPGTGIGSVAAVETWARTAAYIHQKVATTGQPEGWQADKIYGISSDGHAVSFKPYGPQSAQISSTNNVWLGLSPNEPFPVGTVRTAYTQAEIDATWAVEKASIEATLAHPPSDGFLAATGIKKSDFNDPTLLGGIPISGSTANGAITGSTVSKGTEIELVANPLKGLSVSFNAARTDASRVSIAQSFIDYLSSRRAIFYNSAAGDMRLWSSGEDDNHLDPYTTQGDGNTTFAFKDKADAPLGLFLASEGTQAPEVHPWQFNVVANYAFQQEAGPLKGFNVGAGYRWQDRNIIGYAVTKDSFGNEIYDVAHPYYGPAEAATDMWLGYERKLSRKLKWRAQLNIRNVFANDKLIKAQANPDGTGAAYRIPEPRTITLTNSIEF